MNGCNVATVDLATDAETIIFTGKCVLLGVYVDTVLSAQACPILDGAVAKLNLPASFAAGQNLSWPFGIPFDTSLVVNSNDAATGTILVFWKPAGY